MRGVVCPECAVVLEAHRPRWVDGPAGLDRLLVLHPYEPVVRSLVLSAKNGGRRPLLLAWGRDLAEAVPAGPGGVAGSTGARAEVVTWVPASRDGRRRRGYDQGRVLARAVAAAGGPPARRLLVRRADASRRGTDRDQRLLGPDLRCPLTVPSRILLVDDVATTGASLASAARALRRAGAAEVIGAVVALADRRLVGSPSGEEDLWQRTGDVVMK